MNAKSFSIVVIFVILLANTTSLSNAVLNDSTMDLKITAYIHTGNILYVGGSGPGNYTTIQSAIDNTSSDGDTVFVYNGSYYENIAIHKRIKLVGNNPNNTIISGFGSGTIVTINADNVNISGFTIRSGNLGIKINSNFTCIQKNRIIENYDGLLIEHADKSIIFDNDFHSNLYWAIQLWYCSRSIIKNNTVINNGFGVLFISSHMSYVLNNNISNHSLAGLDLVFSSNNLISFNNFFSNNVGIWLGDSTSNLIKYNNIAYNNMGIEFSCSKYNSISYNNIYNNKKEGAYLYRYFSNAINNWWGSSSGPYQKVTNRRGDGDNISCSLGYLFYRPYLKYPVNFLHAELSSYPPLKSTKTSSLIDKNIYDILKVDGKTSINFGLFDEQIPMEIIHSLEIIQNDQQVSFKKLFTKDVNNYDMVIIAPKCFVKSLSPLVKHKNSVGIKTKLVSLSEIYGSYAGHDRQEKIKYFIRDALEYWNIKYVLLVGSIDKLPIRTVWSAGNRDVITDLYYSDIYDENGKFCSWDSNNNGFYGEFDHNGETDKVDLIPDVGVGRLACRNLHEVSIVVDKIIHYEKDTSDRDWFKKILLCGGDTFPNFGDINEGEFLCEKIAEIMKGFISLKLFMSNGNLSTQNITKEINDGVGFVLFEGHGGPWCWLTYSSNKNDERVVYSVSDLFKLNNGYKLPIMCFDACLTAQLDTLIPCLAWSTVAKRNGGSIASLGCVRVSLPIIEKNGLMGGTNLLTFLFFNSYKNSITLSDMLRVAQKEYIKRVGRDYITLEEFILLGDPSLKIGGYP